MQQLGRRDNDQSHFVVLESETIEKGKAGREGKSW